MPTDPGVQPQGATCPVNRTPPTRSDARLGTAPGALPGIGHALQLLRRPLDFLDSLAPLGDIVRIRMGRHDAYVPTRPDLVWEVLVNPSVYDKGGPVFEKARYVLGNGLATCLDEPHHRQRRMMSASFDPQRLSGYGQVVSEAVDKVTGRWDDGRLIEATTEMMTVTTIVAARTLAATIDDAGVQEILKHYATITRGGYRRIVAPRGFAEHLPTPEVRRYVHAKNTVRALVTGIIERQRDDPTDRGDMVSSLLAARDVNGQSMTDDELRDQAMILLTGEVETTGAALAWAFHLVAQHPRIERALHEEADRVLGGRTATWQDLPHLDVTTRILNEALRLYPPVWFLTRETTKDVELGGLPLRRGTTVVFSSYVLHRRPDLFPEPGRFDPDRWLSGQSERLPRGAYLPFAAGSRRCIGDNFALGEAAVVLASVAARWKLEPVAGSIVRPVPRAILRPGQLPMRVRARS
ncbi:cytochrome P450 [Streptomyces sp. NPDC005122]